MGEVRENQTLEKAIESYRDLRVWRAGIELTVACYAETKNFPQTETYGLTSQIRRASTSIPANIAEGYGRDQAGSYVEFLRVAQGSLKELETHVIVAKEVGYLSSHQEARLLQKSDEVGRMLRALIRGLQRTM
ncbi:four helix bundle protein [Mesorhizobium sp. IMUNJ 23232]|uniref:four helix bundle protein n=1 Tax=Mesorhizobium sp. IMUNJ 23232 TaxID=3376064 RepID=UPI003798325A